jgi:hypothetical protein
MGVVYIGLHAVSCNFLSLQECLKDISRALSLTSDSNLRAKLSIRRFKCLKILKKLADEDEINTDSALGAVSDLPLR